MDDFISREAAIEIICGPCAFKTACYAGVEPRCSYYIRMAQIPAADVVDRDCYDRILAENDTMREMIAGIGKKPGDKMDDVRPVVRGHWISHTSDLFPADSTIECDQCHEEQPAWIGDNFCPHCGADMREDNDGR